VERLYGGAMSPDDQEPEALERRRVAAQAEADRDAYRRAQARGRWAEAAPGMAVDAHPHDAPPSGRRPPPTAAEIADDPTGRRAYEADTSPMVLVTRWCTAPGCAAHDTWYGREDTLQRIRKAGGPRCTDHPLEPDADELDQTDRPDAHQEREPHVITPGRRDADRTTTPTGAARDGREGPGPADSPPPSDTGRDGARPAELEEGEPTHPGPAAVASGGHRARAW
jgi:hypothetical protein